MTWVIESSRRVPCLCVMRTPLDTFRQISKRVFPWAMAVWICFERKWIPVFFR